jgi:disulfide bond formation protein DsbB
MTEQWDTEVLMIILVQIIGLQYHLIKWKIILIIVVGLVTSLQQKINLVHTWLYPDIYKNGSNPS